MAPDPDLAAAARRALDASHRHVCAFEVGGRRMFAKRLRPPPRHWFTTTIVRRLLAAVAGFPLPPMTPEARAAAWRPDHEAERLEALAAEGVRVPAVLARTNDLIVIEDAGPDVARRLETWTQAVWRRELGRLAEDLGRLHRAKRWHGAAQIKNVAIDPDGGFRRFDFEENAGALVPLPIIQTADLLQFLNTVALAGPIDEAESESLLTALVDRYFAVTPGDGVRQTLERGLPLLRFGLAVTALFARRSRKGIRRARIEARVLERMIAHRRGPPAPGHRAPDER